MAEDPKIVAIAEQIAESPLKTAMFAYLRGGAEKIALDGDTLARVMHGVPHAIGGGLIGGTTGALGGALTAGDDERLEGALRGGLAGGVTGTLLGGVSGVHAGDRLWEHTLKGMERHTARLNEPPTGDFAKLLKDLGDISRQNAEELHGIARDGRRMTGGVSALGGAITGPAAGLSARETEKQAVTLGDIVASHALQGATIGGLGGGISGAITGGEGHRMEGAARGAVGGALAGGVTGGVSGGLGGKKLLKIDDDVAKVTAREQQAFQDLIRNHAFQNVGDMVGARATAQRELEETVRKMQEPGYRVLKNMQVGTLGGGGLSGAVGGGLAGRGARDPEPEKQAFSVSDAAKMHAVQGALMGGLGGGVSGAITGGEGHRMEGAARGAVGGALTGGIVGGLSGHIGGKRLQKVDEAAAAIPHPKIDIYPGMSERDIAAAEQAARASFRDAVDRVHAPVESTLRNMNAGSIIGSGLTGAVGGGLAGRSARPSEPEKQAMNIPSPAMLGRDIPLDDVMRNEILRKALFGHTLAGSAAGSLVGMGVGAAQGGEGHRMEGAARGGMIGAGAGALAGAGAGLYAGKAMPALHDSYIDTLKGLDPALSEAERQSAEGAAHRLLFGQLNQTAAHTGLGAAGGGAIAGGAGAAIGRKDHEKTAVSSDALWALAAAGYGAANAPSDYAVEGAGKGLADLAGAEIGGRIGVHGGKYIGGALARAAGIPEGAGEALGTLTLGIPGVIYGARGGEALYGQTGAGRRLEEARMGIKQASVGSVLARALGGAAIGGAVGGGGGALLAKLRGEDPAQAAIRGGIGGAGLGALGGGLSAFSSGHEALADSIFRKGTEKAIIGGGAVLGGMAMSGMMGSSDSAAREAAEREQGRMQAMQQFKQQQLLRLTPMHEEAFAAAQADEVVSRADPAMIHSSFETMKRFAPNLAADPNATRSFLRESAVWGTGPNYATLKNLADAERSVAGAGGASA